MTTTDHLPSAASKAPSYPRRGRTRVRKLGTGQRFGAGVVWAVVAFNIFLFAWLIMSSFKTTREIFINPWSLPTSVTFENYTTAIREGNFGVAAFNSILVVSASSIAIIVVAAPAGYALSRIHTRLNGPLTLAFAVGMGIPFQVILIPLFVMMQRIGLVDSLFGLALLYVALQLPFTIILLTGFFGTLPVEIEEAAALDGASPLRIFVSVMLPLSRSGLITALLLNAIGLWNELFVALIFLQSDERQTLPLALLGFMQRQQYNAADWGGLFAGVTLIVLPMVLLYFWLGRKIIEGMTLGVGK